MKPWQARCVQGYVAVHLHSKINLGAIVGATAGAAVKLPSSFESLNFACCLEILRPTHHRNRTEVCVLYLLLGRDQSSRYVGWNTDAMHDT
jgi:hypothetical protein